jgi:manganese transport protein
VEIGRTADGLRRGLPMVQARDPGALEKERDFLREVNARRGIVSRWRGYWSLAGPGWVQSALTLGARPYDAFWKVLHPALAVAWGTAVLLASIVWQFPQYALATAVAKDILDVAGLEISKAPIALILLAAGTALCWSYGRGSRRAVRLFERVLKYLLLVMVASFLLVVIKTGVDLKALARGFFSFSIPRDREGLTIVLGALGAAVGINMTFLYPYMLLARG